MLVMFPTAFCAGMTLPLATHALTTRGHGEAAIGSVYAANTIGAIVGSLTASLLLVVWLGSQSAQRLLIVLSVMASLLALDAASSDGTETAPSRGKMRLGGTLLIVGAAMLAAWLARNVGAVPAILVAYGRYAASRIGQADVIDMREGWNASIAPRSQWTIASAPPGSRYCESSASSSDAGAAGRIAARS